MGDVVDLRDYRRIDGSVYMTRARAAEYLGVSTRTVARWVGDEGLRAYRVRGGWMFRRGELDGWMRNRTT